MPDAGTMTIKNLRSKGSQVTPQVGYRSAVRHPDINSEMNISKVKITVVVPPVNGLFERVNMDGSEQDTRWDGAPNWDGASTKQRAPGEPQGAFDELGKIVFAESSFNDVMARVAELAKRTIPGAAQVSLTLITGDQANTAAWTGRMALGLDERQYEDGSGPCIDAARWGGTVVIDDMANDPRYPTFGPRAIEQGALSTLSVGLQVQKLTIGTLNIYGITMGAFDSDSVHLAQTFASYAAVALANARLYASTAELAAQLTEAMTSRSTIEQAKGIIIAKLGCSAEVAFDVLSRTSQNANRKLREVAVQVIEEAQKSNHTRLPSPAKFRPADGSNWLWTSPRVPPMN